jgi:hypothetical protein
MLLVILGAGVCTLWRRSKFPGTWAHTFHAEYRDERALLAQARRALREVDRDLRQAETEAREQVSSAREERAERIGKLTREVARLREPGRGTELNRLGGLVLYEHAVVASPEGEELPLAGLRARVERSDDLWMYLTKPDGSGDVAKFPYRRDPATAREENVQLFDELQVRRLEMRMNQAAADEKVFRAGLAMQLAQAQEELAEARKDTGLVDLAQQNLEEPTDRIRTDPRRKEALANLEVARDRWQKLTGRRPPR